MPSSAGEVATSTVVAAPCSGVFTPIPVAVTAGTDSRVDASTSGFQCRCRFVQMPPGIRAFEVMPSSVQRRVASTANSTCAVLDCP